MRVIEAIKNNAIILIARGIPDDKLVNAAEAAFQGGIRSMEVTFIQNGDPEDTANAIRRLRGAFGGELLVGAGTVMTEDQAKLARQAGALYAVSPNTDERVIKACKRLGLISIPGAFTPSEVALAYSLGADMVKVFPADIGGPAYIRALKGPFAHIPLAAVGGVTPETIRPFYQAGAEAFGVSSGILPMARILRADYQEITRRARAYMEALCLKK